MGLALPGPSPHLEVFIQLRSPPPPPTHHLEFGRVLLPSRIPQLQAQGYDQLFSLDTQTAYPLTFALLAAVAVRLCICQHRALASRSPAMASIRCALSANSMRET